ncbi:MAG: TRAP transporter small permease [Gammaproteobacteria bacterium]
MSPAFLGRLDRLGRRLENASLVLLLSAMIALAAAQIFLRNVLDSGLVWADELLRILVLWVAMLGAVAASRDRHQITIDILSRFLPQRARIVTGLLVDLFTAGIAGLLAWHSGRFVAETLEYGDRILGDLPAWLFQAILPVAFGLIAWRYLLFFLGRIGELRRA